MSYSDYLRTIQDAQEREGRARHPVRRNWLKRLWAELTGTCQTCGAVLVEVGYSRPDAEFASPGGTPVLACPRCEPSGVSKEAGDIMSKVDVKRLVNAVVAIYSAGHWTCDRPVNENALWDELKRAAGIPHGTAPKPIDPMNAQAARNIAKYGERG